MAMDSQESIFGPESSAPPAQSSIQPQLQEQDTKLDDCIDDQQQARTNITSSHVCKHCSKKFMKVKAMN